MRFNIFLCFFLRMRLRRFLTRDPMRLATLRGLPASALLELDSSLDGGRRHGDAGEAQAVAPSDRHVSAERPGASP